MNHWHLRCAVRALDAGGVVLHATEGVWGLACDPFDPSAVSRILTLKERDVAKGLIVVGGDATQFAPELEDLKASERHRVEQSWPGAVTWILPTRRFPAWITGGRGTVAARVSGHPQVRALSVAFGAPLVSTSANRSGRPAARNQIRARANFGQLVDYVLPGEVLHGGNPSTIRTLDGDVLRGVA